MSALAMSRHLPGATLGFLASQNPIEDVRETRHDLPAVLERCDAQSLPLQNIAGNAVLFGDSRIQQSQVKISLVSGLDRAALRTHNFAEQIIGLDRQVCWIRRKTLLNGTPFFLESFTFVIAELVNPAVFEAFVVAFQRPFGITLRSVNPHRVLIY